jgi:signal transduction histidine kinase
MPPSSSLNGSGAGEEKARSGIQSKLAFPQTIHLILYLLLIITGGLSIGLFSLVHNTEKLRLEDASLLSLAGAQGSLCQRMSRYSMVSQREQSEVELKSTLATFEAKSKTLSLLLETEMDSAFNNQYSRKESLGAAALSWRTEMAALAKVTHQLIKLMEQGESVMLGPASAFVQIQSDRTLETSERLAMELEKLVDERSKKSLATITKLSMVYILVVFALALLVVEPVAKLIRDQYAKLKSQGADLERLASERERMAAESWEAAQNAARKAVEEKSLFLAIGSHDLRTPLQTILLTVDLMTIQSKNPDLFLDEAPTNLSKLRIACTHTLGIATDLGEFVRESEGYGREAPKAVRLGELLLGVLDLYYEEASEKGLDIELIEGHATDIVSSEENFLRRIISNLVANAIKFTQEGRVVIRSSTPSPGELLIEVIDTGIGIESDLLESISKPFYRGLSGRRYNKHGLGLGLAIVDRFVSFLGGTWDVESTPGAGSRFAVRLPMVAAREAPASIKHFTTAPVLPSGARLVVVDDDPRLLKDICCAINALGDSFFAIGFEDTAQAFAYLLAHPVDIVFIDLQMNPVNGCSFAQMLRAEPTLAGLKLLAMSAYMLDRANEEAFDGFMPKPISLDRLILCVAETLRTESGGPAPFERKTPQAITMAAP